jgi:hypothetical protein
MRCRSFLKNKKGQLDGAGAPGGARGRIVVIIVLIVILIISLFGGLRAYGFLQAGGFETLEEGVMYDFYQSYKSGKQSVQEIVSGEILKGSGDYFGDTREGDYDRLGVELRSIEPLISNVYAGEDFRLKYNFEVHGLEALGGFIDSEFFCYMNSDDFQDYFEEETLDVFGTVSPNSDVILTETTGNVYCDISGESTEGLSEPISVYGWIEFPMERQIEIVTYLWDGEVADTSSETFYSKYDKSDEFADAAYNGEPIEIGMAIQGEEDDVVIVRDEDITTSTIGMTFTNKWGGDLVSIEEIKLTLGEGLELDEDADYPKQWCPFEYASERGGQKTYIMDDYYRDLIWPIDEYGFVSLADSPSIECELWADDILDTAAFKEADITLDVTYTYKTDTADEQLEIIGEDESLVASTDIVGDLTT